MTKLLSENKVSGKTKEIYDEIIASFGMVPNFFKAQAAVDVDWFELFSSFNSIADSLKVPVDEVN